MSHLDFQLKHYKSHRSLRPPPRFPQRRFKPLLRPNIQFHPLRHNHPNPHRPLHHPLLHPNPQTPHSTPLRRPLHPLATLL
jgi:hypothetical protein